MKIELLNVRIHISKNSVTVDAMNTTLAEKQPQSLMYLFMEMRSVLLTISKKELIVNVGGISVEK